MIRASFSHTPDGTYTGFTVRGHAGSGEYGNDIVCAAVSALTVHTVNAVERHTGTPLVCKVSSGRISAHFPGRPEKTASLFVQALAEGLEGIRTEYGSEYITIADEEVNNDSF